MKQQPAKQKKLVYLANIGLPGDWAHSVQVMKMCEAFAAAGLNVELLVPRRSAKALLEGDPFVYYGVKPIFKITRLLCLDLTPGGASLWNFLARTLSFLLAARLYLFFKQYDILYTREQLAGLWFCRVIYELHHLPRRPSFWHKLNWRQARALIALTRFIKEQLISWGISENKILVAGDAVNLEQFSLNISQAEARQSLSLPSDKKIIVYVGSFFTHSWKGIDVLLKAASFLPQYLFVLVGGNANEIKQVKEECQTKNILMVGQQPNRLVPIYMAAADALVLPNKSGSDHSEKFTSPMKLFEYMAAGRPIVASDLPTIREALNDNNSVLVAPNSPESFVEGITKALENETLADSVSRQALADVQQHTWLGRADKIINFIK